MTDIKSEGFVINEAVYQSTPNLISFIEKYGVDHYDDENRCILEFISLITKPKIDIIFDHKPNLMISKEDDNFLMFCGFHSIYSNYIFQKMIECDENFLIITEKTRYLIDSSPILRMIRKTYKEIFMEYSNYNDYWRERSKPFIVLLENHEKKYYTLFDLMKEHID